MTDNDFLEIKTITVQENGKELKVYAGDYAKVKTRHLIEFGYTTLTEKDVLNSVRRVLNDEKFTDIIDHFVKEDIVKTK